MDNEINRVISLRLDPAVVTICNGELAPRTRIIPARDAHSACRMIASGGAVVVVSHAAPFWDVHVVREHAERHRLPLVAVAADAAPFDLVRDVEAAIASQRRRRAASGPPSSRSPASVRRG